jgi:hypothetical protein
MEPISPDLVQTPGSLAHSYVAERGIFTDSIQTYGIQIETEPTSESFRERLGFDTLSEGKLASLAKEVIWFPCYDSAGRLASWIARPLPSIGSAKFLNPQGTAFPFIPSQTWVAANKPHKALIVTEGPVKALAVAQAGQLAISISGVWMATKKGDDAKTSLAPALTTFVWSGRTVYLAFDADSGTNPKVKQALLRTFLGFYIQGAKVRFLSWPLSEGKGIDDYLYDRQKAGEEPAKTLARLIDNAHEVNLILSPEDLKMVTEELKIANLARTQINQLTRILADPLKVRASAIEEEIVAACAQTDTKAFGLPDPEPWPHTFEPGEMLSEIMELFQKHIVMSKSQALVTALWVVLTYVSDHVDVLPILGVTSPTKRCGKTRLMECLVGLTRRALQTSNVSAAALYRSVEKWAPTLLIDEADTFLDDNEELRGIINSGHTRSMAYVIRCDGETLEPRRFSTWAPKVLAKIGRLPDTIQDRSIEIRLQRRTKAEPVEPVRATSPETFERLTRQLVRWALDHGDKICSVKAQIPRVLNDRAADNWLPLFAIAEVVSGDWPKAVTTAALELCGSDDSEETVQIRLLLALQKLFEPSVEFMATDQITEALSKMQEAPWADWRHGMTAKKLAQTLRPFGVEPRQKRQHGEPVRGYLREDLQPVFGRYLSLSHPLAPKNDALPLHPPANQLPDLISGVTGSENNPVMSHIQNSNPLRCESASRLDPQSDVKGEQQKKGMRDDSEVNRFKLTPEEAKKVIFAAELFDGQIAGADEPEIEPEPRSLPRKASRAGPNTQENRLIAALAPYDYEGGLFYGEWRRLTGLPDEIFNQTLNNLCRPGGPVYKSQLNGRYQLSPRFARILARQKGNGTPLKSGG